MNLRRDSVALGLSLLIPSTVVLTETVILKNGTTIKGSIVQMTETDITIDTADLGQMVVKRRAVQSINDGIVVNEPVVSNVPQNGAVAPASSLVNINNDNNNAQTVALTATSVPKDDKPIAVEKSTITSAPESASRLGGSLNAGVVRLSHFEGIGPEFLPILHWEPLGYQFSNGVSLDVIGDVMNKEQDSNTFKFNHGGVALGFGTQPPRVGQSGAVFLARFSYGIAYLERRPTDDIPAWVEDSSHNESYDNGYTYHHRSVLKSSGSLVGIHLGYTYYSSGGVGLNIGGSGLQGRMKHQDVETHYYGYTGYYSATPTQIYEDESSRHGDVRALEAYAGLAYRF